jgi:hypothetical protein
MITLHLTLSQLKQLRQLLANQVDADEHKLLRAQLDIAQAQATEERICPVCQTTFTQLKAGRNARYCSAACKQKAYRQRRDQARRQCGPRRHTS